MKIILNGDSREVSAQSLADVLGELGLGDAVVATALNGEFVATAARSTTAVSPGDEIEVLAPMQGG